MNKERTRRIHSDGYAWVYCPEHPRSSKDYVREHIVVVEGHINRAVSIKEEIHHLNGIKHDNRIENLLLCKDLNEHRKLHRMSTWSRNNSHCVVCRTTEIKHEGKGLCNICYLKHWRMVTNYKEKQRIDNARKQQEKTQHLQAKG